MCVTIGSFDMQNTELLRTCSEPDLAGLFRTMSKESPVARRHSLSDMSTVQEEVSVCKTGGEERKSRSVCNET